MTIDLCRRVLVKIPMFVGLEPTMWLKQSTPNWNTCWHTLRQPSQVLMVTMVVYGPQHFCYAEQGLTPQIKGPLCRAIQHTIY